MRFLFGAKDGGSESHVYMYGLESKGLGSILALRFEDGSREAFHSHAFGAVSWLLTGCLIERVREPFVGRVTYWPSLRPILTARARMHKVSSVGRSWVFSLRGPWAKTWQEIRPIEGQVTLTHGRRRVG